LSEAIPCLSSSRWREEIPEMVRLADLHPQNADADRATLFLDG